MKVLYVGSGAVNLCLAGWMHSATSQTHFLVRTEDNEIIGNKAFQCRLPGDKNTRVYRCTASSTLEDVQPPDLVVVGVKHHALDEVLDQLEQAFGQNIPLMSVLNGVDHIHTISARFPRSFFATITFNAYRTSPSVAVATGGSLGLSAFDAENAVMHQVHRVLKRKIRVSLVNDPLSAAHCKLVVNLNNALLTMVAFHEHRSRQLDVVQQLSARIMNEGVDVLKEAGIKEARIPGMPNWFLIRLSKMLPKKLVLIIFERNIRSTSINSMAQDVRNGSGTTEIEYINGYFVKMAERLGVEVPYNRALYHLFKQWVDDGAQPLRPSVLLSRISSFSNL